MARRTARPKPTRELELPALTRTCPGCGGPPWAADKNRRIVTTFEGVVRPGIQVRRRRRRECRLRGRPVRPGQEGRGALPQHEFGLDVIAPVGRHRHAEHRRAPEIHAGLVRRGVSICPRRVANLRDRYDELLAPSTSEVERLRRITAAAGRVSLALDGLPPDVGHEALGVLRDVLSGAVLLARSLLPSTQDDLAGLLREVRDALPVPIAGVVSDGQEAIRKAVQKALGGVPHHPCQLPYLREAARPIDEADRHAKVPLKKQVRGIRPRGRTAEGRGDADAEATRRYCAAARGALTDDGRPPREASGLKLADRLTAVAAGLDRGAGTRGSRRD